VTNTIITYILAGLGAASAVWGYLSRARRTPLWLAAVCFACAAAAAYYDAFWPTVSFGVLGVFAFIASLNLIDLGWRMRFGFGLSVTTIAFVSLWPTLGSMSGGKFPCPEYVQKRVAARLVAGLDLRGGLRLVYTVDVDEAIKDRRDRFYDDMRSALSKAYALHSGDQAPSEQVLQQLREKVVIEAPRKPANQIRLTFKDPADIASKVDARFRDQFRADLGDPAVSANVVTYHMRDVAESQIRDRAVAQAKDIIVRRVDELGLKEASVSTRDEDIIVEVPGQDEKGFNTIREIISQTAKLEFKLLDDDADFFRPYREKLERKELKDAPEGLHFETEAAPVGKQGDEVLQKTNTFAFLEMLEGEDSKSALKRFRAWVETLSLPPDREVGFELVYRTVDEETQKQVESGWRTFFLKSRADITGQMITDARAQPSQDRGSLGGWHVALTFTDAGGTIFERITAANIKRRFAIILDNRVESAPVIQTRIPGGHAQITMGSSDPEIQLRDARKLELVLRSGALPAPISPSNEQHIGPSLGSDSIRLGVQGAIGGVSIVLLFMLFYYAYAGLIADIAVMLNVFLQLAILASFGASMTLPGIAGVALTVGMGVDANVLINERIRDELRHGKSHRAAISIGFSRALTAIIDGHVTTLIAGIVLAQYGTGPIKGFAVTLMVGVMANIYTAVVISRLMFDFYARALKPAKLRMG
jgi:preprotein translocase subunit SecD